MQYQVGKTGRVIVARFEDGDEIIQGLTDIVKKESIRAAVFYLVGGIKEGKIVVGPENDVLPPTPVWKMVNESHESVGVGTIFWDEKEPRIHFHGTYGKDLCTVISPEITCNILIYMIYYLILMTRRRYP